MLRAEGRRSPAPVVLWGRVQSGNLSPSERRRTCLELSRPELQLEAPTGEVSEHGWCQRRAVKRRPGRVGEHQAERANRAAVHRRADEVGLGERRRRSRQRDPLIVGEVLKRDADIPAQLIFPKSRQQRLQRGRIAGKHDVMGSCLSWRLDRTRTSASSLVEERTGTGGSRPFCTAAPSLTAGRLLGKSCAARRTLEILRRLEFWAHPRDGSRGLVHHGENFARRSRVVDAVRPRDGTVANARAPALFASRATSSQPRTTPTIAAAPPIRGSAVQPSRFPRPIRHRTVSGGPLT